MKAPWIDEPIFCLTSDVDWASEAAIEYSHGLIKGLGIKPTVFNTHQSNAIESFEKCDEIEVGLHPNFLNGSSQGDTFPEILDFLTELHPSATCFRSHRFFDVTDINMQLKDRGFKYDSNVFTFLNKIPPYRHFSGLVRFPCFWEDGTYLMHGLDLDISSFREELYAPGLTILNIHPMHMVMNSPDLDWSRTVKASVTREEWNTMDGKTFDKVTYKGRGIRDFVMDMLESIVTRGYKVHTLHELYNIYLATEFDKKSK